LIELKQMRKIRDDMEKTHLEEQGSVKLEEEDVKPTMGIKSEDGEVKMEGLSAEVPDPNIDAAELATSPLTKKRLASRPSVCPAFSPARLPSLTLSSTHAGPTIPPFSHLHHIPLRIHRTATSSRQPSTRGRETEGGEAGCY
jgi:hypothetical protein